MSRRVVVALIIAGSLTALGAGVFAWADREVFAADSFRVTATASLETPSSVAALTALTLDELLGDEPILAAALRVPAEAAIAANLALPEVRVVLDDLAANLYEAVAVEPQPVVIEFSRFRDLLVDLAAGVAPELATLISSDLAQVELFSTGEVTDLSALNRASTAVWLILGILALGCFSAVAAGGRSVQLVGWIGIGLAGAGAALVALSWFGRWFALRAVDHPDGKVILGNAYDALAQSLGWPAFGAMVAGAALFAAARAWEAFAGPTAS